MVTLTQDEVRLVVAETRTLLNLVEVAESESGFDWVLVFDDDMVVFAELDEPSNRLSLLLELGTPQDTSRNSSNCCLHTIVNGRTPAGSTWRSTIWAEQWSRGSICIWEIWRFLVSPISC